MTGIRQAGERWEVWLDGALVGTKCSYSRAYEYLHDFGARFGYDHAALVAKVQATQEQLRQEAQAATETVATRATAAQDATEAPAQVKTSKGRCPHYKAIRRAFAIATDLGLDTKADAAMRRAFSMFLHRDVPSRESLSGGEWMLLGDAMKAHRLAW